MSHLSYSSHTKSSSYVPSDLPTVLSSYDECWMDCLSPRSKPDLHFLSDVIPQEQSMSGISLRFSWLGKVSRGELLAARWAPKLGGTIILFGSEKQEKEEGELEIM